MKKYVRSKVVKIMDKLKAEMRKEYKERLGRALTDDEHTEIRKKASEIAEKMLANSHNTDKQGTMPATK